MRCSCVVILRGLALTCVLSGASANSQYQTPGNTPQQESDGIPASPAYIVEGAKNLNDAWNDINRKLEQPVRMNQKNVPLRTAAASIAQQVGVTLRYDTAALTEEDIGLDTPVTILADGISARSAFEQMQEVGVTLTISGETLSLTTILAADETTTIRVYPVSDLVEIFYEGKLAYDFQSLINLLQNTTGIGTWQEIDQGNGYIMPFSRGRTHMLVIRQSFDVHYEIEMLLHDMRNAVKDGKRVGRASGPNFNVAQDLANNRPVALPRALFTPPVADADVVARVQRQDGEWKSLNDRLGREVALDLTNVSCREALQRVAARVGVTARISGGTTRESKAALDKLVCLHSVDMSAADLLATICRADVAVFSDGEELKIVPTDEAAWIDDATICIYPITDLTRDGLGVPRAFDLGADLKLAVENVTTGPWQWRDGEGGTASTLTVADCDLLVVQQSVTGHYEVEMLLHALRAVPHSPKPPIVLSKEELDFVTATMSSLNDWYEPRPKHSTMSRMTTDEIAAETAAQRVYDSAMTQPVNATFDKTPLRKAIESLFSGRSLPLEFDDSLAEAGVDLNKPVSMKVENDTLESAAGRLLAPLGLTIRRDGRSIVISEADHSGEAFTTRYYSVSDLTWRIGKGGRAKHRSEPLVEMITAMSGDGWNREGEDDPAYGSIERFEDGSANLFAVNNTEATHRRIDELLYRIRSAAVAAQ